MPFEFKLSDERDSSKLLGEQGLSSECYVWLQPTGTWNGQGYNQFTVLGFNIVGLGYVVKYS